MHSSAVLVCVVSSSLLLATACTKPSDTGSGGHGGTANGGTTSKGGTSGAGGASAKGGSAGSGGIGGSGGKGGAAGSGGAGGTAGSGGASGGAGGKATGGTGGVATGGSAGKSAGGAGGAASVGGSSGAGGSTVTGGTGGGATDACTSPAQGDVTMSAPSGLFKGTLAVTLSTSISGAEIRYTTDGKAPTSSSTLYSGEIKLTGTTRLRAQAFVQGTASGKSSGALYVATTFDATHDLSVIVLDSYGSGKLPTAEAQRQFVDVAYLAFEPGSSGGTIKLADKPTVAAFAAFHVRGNSSAMFDKVPYRLELRNEAGEDRDCPVLGMPAESDWAMVGPHSDKTLVHNNFIYELGRDMGMATPRVKLAEVYVNVDKDPLSDTDYQGVYQIIETIKNQKNRLNLKQLNETKTTDADISGGYIFSFEWMITAEHPITCPSGTANPWTYLELVDPIPFATQQMDYLTKHLLSLHTALHGSNIADASSGYPNYIEPKTWVDQIIVNELGRNMDAYARSQYFYKDRNAKINAGPLWDFDLIAGSGLNTTAMANTATEGWQYEGNASRLGGATSTGTGTGGSMGFPGGGIPGGGSSGTADWFPILLKDPTFKVQLIARWKELRGGLLSDSAIASRIDALTAGLSAAADRNFAKWKILSQAQVKPFDTPTASTWAAQITYMKDWLKKRAAWLDTQWK